VGAGVGALIGTLSRSERWLPIRPDDLRVQVSGAGVGVSLSIPVGCCSRPVGAD
jgi:hypothetical protein